MTTVRSQRVVHRVAAAAAAGLGQVFYHRDDEGTWERFETTLTTELWEDLGSPEVITVTVEPGDLLN